ncbi:MAG TPA: MlaD family protein [Solirubrobacteraceae bacterium]|nr:MlaD family protein [Solirubrobacteraceae bacterium]
MRDRSVGRRRAVVGAASACAVAVLVVLALSAGGSNGSYEVRAIFDDAGNIIPGEQVKIAGVKVGKVTSVTPTPAAKAAVVLSIDNNGFKDFRADASCEIRPQALIGEKYVDCLPTQPRVPGTALPPPLHKIPGGHEGSGQYLLPVQNTSSPVDVDLLGDINRLPERQRLTIILNELGAGLAGRGSDLHEVIRRANPALREFDKVLSILASENQVLTKLAEDSDRALAPFAHVRQQVADFLAQSNTVAKASAAQRGALARNLQLFPPFLRQLGPAMERLERFADQTLPTFTSLNKAAPSISKAFVNLPGFSASSEKFFISTGETAKRSGPALTQSKKLLAQLKALGTPAKPFSENFASLFTSLRDTGGLERIMDFIFLGAGAANGYDQLGHFLRTEGVGNQCVKYFIKTEPSCNRRLGTVAASAKASAASVSHEPAGLVMERTLAVLKGATPAQANAKYPGTPAPGETPGSSPAPASNSAGGAPSSQPVGGSTSGTTYYSPSDESPEADGMLLNYLLGN